MSIKNRKSNIKVTLYIYFEKLLSPAHLRGSNHNLLVFQLLFVTGE
jgi:hypothetical protein